MFLVYILFCSDGTFYTGITNDLENRLKMHESGKGSKYVRARLPAKVIYTETYSTKSEALKREIAIKKMKKSEKVHLLSSSGTNSSATSSGKFS